MATSLGYSNMTMTRAFDELESAGLGQFAHEGRTRTVRFNEPEEHIWQAALPFLRNPVKKRFFIEPADAGLPGVRAGLSALAERTSLAAPTGPVVALGAGEWAAFERHTRITEYPVSEPDAWEIEVWRYDPGLFATENTVDRLSLYLSLNGDGDERVEIAIEEMMKGLPW